LGPACSAPIQFQVKQAAGKRLSAAFEAIGRAGSAIDGATFFRGNGLAARNKKSKKQKRSRCEFHSNLRVTGLCFRPVNKSINRRQIITKRRPVLSQLIDRKNDFRDGKKYDGA
jgi:hypothetical protein